MNLVQRIGLVVALQAVLGGQMSIVANSELGLGIAWLLLVIGGLLFIFGNGC